MRSAADSSHSFWSRMAATPTPRPMGLATRLSLLLDPLFFFGAFFAGFGGAFVIPARPHDSVAEWVAFRGELDTEPAVVTDVAETNMTENESRIRRVEATFEHAGTQHRITSYRLSCDGPQPGDPVQAEFPPGNPAGARLVGHRRAPFAVFICFIFLFPAIGLALMYFSLRGGLRRMRHLRDGLVTVGMVTSRTRTNMQINDEHVDKFAYRFTDEAGREVTGSVRTHETKGLPMSSGKVLLSYLTWDTSRVRLINDPESPPDGIRLDEAGVLRGGSVVKAAFGLLVAAGLLAEAAYLMTVA